MANKNLLYISFFSFLLISIYFIYIFKNDISFFYLSFAVPKDPYYNVFINKTDNFFLDRSFYVFSINGFIEFIITKYLEFDKIFLSLILIKVILFIYLNNHYLKKLSDSYNFYPISLIIISFLLIDHPYLDFLEDRYPRPHFLVIVYFYLSFFILEKLKDNKIHNYQLFVIGFLITVICRQDPWMGVNFLSIYFLLYILNINEFLKKDFSKTLYILFGVLLGVSIYLITDLNFKGDNLSKTLGFKDIIHKTLFFEDYLSYLLKAKWFFLFITILFLYIYFFRINIKYILIIFFPLIGVFFYLIIGKTIQSYHIPISINNIFRIFIFIIFMEFFLKVLSLNKKVPYLYLSLNFILTFAFIVCVYIFTNYGNKWLNRAIYYQNNYDSYFKLIQNKNSNCSIISNDQTTRSFVDAFTNLNLIPIDSSAKPKDVSMIEREYIHTLSKLLELEFIKRNPDSLDYIKRSFLEYTSHWYFDISRSSYHLDLRDKDYIDLSMFNNDHSFFSTPYISIEKFNIDQIPKLSTNNNKYELTHVLYILNTSLDTENSPSEFKIIDYCD